MATKRINKSRKKRQLIGGLLVLALAALVISIIYVAHRHGQPKSSSTSKSNKPAASGTVNLSPPTQSDIEQTDQHKNDITNPTPSSSPAPSNGKKTVTPMISNANSSTVMAYVLGIFEDGGTCTATVSQGSLTFSRTSTGFENSSYTQCTPIDISTGGINSSEKWSIVVSYSSNSAVGTSSVATVTP